MGALVYTGRVRGRQAESKEKKREEKKRREKKGKTIMESGELEESEHGLG